MPFSQTDELLPSSGSRCHGATRFGKLVLGWLGLSVVYVLAIIFLFRISPTLLQPYLDLTQPVSDWVSTWVPAMERIEHKLTRIGYAYRWQVIAHIYAVQVLASSALTLALIPGWRSLQKGIEARLIPTLRNSPNGKRQMFHVALLFPAIGCLLLYQTVWEGTWNSFSEANPETFLFTGIATNLAALSPYVVFTAIYALWKMRGTTQST